MNYRKIICELRDGVVRITLNRPDKRNALDGEMIAELRDAVGASAHDPQCRLVLLAGAGQDFCSGADLEGLDQTAHDDVLNIMNGARGLAELFLAMRRHPHPIVAAVQGRALAGGCGLATACDIILASSSAQFGYPEVNIGFVPAIVMAILRRAVPEKAAFALVTTGEIISAARAHELGIAHAVYGDQRFAADIEAFAARLASKSASAVMLSKRLLYNMDSMTFDTALEAGVETNAIARMTEDCRRGVERFLKKKHVTSS